MSEVSRRKMLAGLAVAPLAAGVVAQASVLDKLLHVLDSSPGKTEDASREKTRKKYFPNFELTTHEGKRVKFYDDLIKDKIVVINFMYAKCDGICVPITANLKRVQKLLGDRVGRDIFMYSITLKPQEDTPEKLNHYVQMHNLKPGWTFLTGKPEEIEILRRKMGLYTSNSTEDKDLTNHIGMVRYGNEARQWWAMFPGKAKAPWIVESILWMDDGNVKKHAPEKTAKARVKPHKH
ncbi:MAG TPA: SCO family protein [Pyrinomonadaceae bacterium]|nr:SCO family protein [Pyrinomonadaceae bacterium]